MFKQLTVALSVLIAVIVAVLFIKWRLFELTVLFSGFFVYILIRWSRSPETVFNKSRLSQIIIVSGIAIGFCKFTEEGACVVGLRIAWICLIIVAPILEEFARFVVIRLLETETIDSATLVGGAMGIVETLIKGAMTFVEPATLIYRTIATVPLHAFGGGILSLGPGKLPITIGLHALFNTGIYFGGIWGAVSSFTAVGMSGIIWFLYLSEEQEKKETTDVLGPDILISTDENVK